MAKLLDPDELSRRVGSVHDFPIPGIVFRDITTLLIDPEAFRSTVGHLSATVVEVLAKVTGRNQHRTVKLAAIESRGFLFGAAVGLELGLPVLLVRKPGKLPRPTQSISYELEYGSDHLEIHTDDVSHDDHVIIIDDLLATGGTVAAAAELLRDGGATVDHAVFVIDLPDLSGAQALAQLDVTGHSIISFSGH